MNIQAPSHQVRIHVLCAALNVSPSQLRIMIKEGKVPPSDHYQHGQYSYWHLSTIRAWRPDVADAVAVIQNVLILQAA